jgi:predicted Zn-dependent protease
MKKLVWKFSLVLLVAAPSTHGFDLNIGKIIESGTEIVKHASNATTDVSEEKEIQLGAGIASNLLGAAPLVANPALQRYVNGVGMWLAAHSERPDLPWRFGVIESTNINAFAAPGGYIFITKGMFLLLRNEAELAGVLAHEIVHVLERHHLEAIKAGAQRELAASVLSMAAEQATDRDLSPLIGSGLQLYARGLDKEDEFEADRMGVVIAARAGYDPYGLLGGLFTLASINPQSDAVTLMFKTHPPAKDRIERVDALLEQHLAYLANQPQVPERVQAYQQKMLATAAPAP